MRNTLLNLPLHPTMRHPLTGQPLRAVGHRKDGRAIWPIMGGAPDDGDNAGDDSGNGDDGAKGGDDGSGNDDSGNAGDKGKGSGGDLGFPQNTPVAEMTAEQQAAYHRHQSRKHEGRASAYYTAVDGLSPDEVKSRLEELDALKRQSMSDQERALEDTKKATREETAREYGPKAVRAALDIALEHLSDEDRNDAIDTLDLTKFLTDSGDVDTAKVRTFAARTAPADKDKGKDRNADFGGGRRGGSKPASGVSAGAARYEQRRGKTAASSAT